MIARICGFILINCVLSSQITAQGFAGLGTIADGFATPELGREITFPEDHSPHPDFRIEWWYLTANLKDAEGHDYGIQWTLFRSALSPNQASGWQNSQIWMGHAAVTSSETHYYAERLARGGIGQAGVVSHPFDAWIDDWSITGDNQLKTLSIFASGSKFSFDLSAESHGDIVLHGAGGFSVKSPTGQASHYYSQPDYSISGMLELPSGPVAVVGKGWLDREWSSQPLAEEQTGWDWFSLRFDTGDKLMGFVLRGDNDTTDFRSGTWISKTGEVSPLQPDAFQATPIDHATVAGRRVPIGWRVELPQKGINVVVKALNNNSWMNVSLPYWEGPVTISGSHSGQGYLEMTGYE